MQHTLNTAILQLDAISAPYGEVAATIQTDLHTLSNAVQAFTLYVPFIGEYSAGKSSLLNTWLCQNLLPEDQTPTTAIATELHYGEEVSMVVMVSETEERLVKTLPMNAAEANTKDSMQGLYAICTTNSPRLHAVAPVIPVDMPGTNSGIERHTKALYQYVNKGEAFFLVVSPDSGTLPASLVAFLDELELGARPLFIVLHKCDLFLPEYVDTVTKEVALQCENLGCPPAAILHTSRLSSDTPELVHAALASLDADTLCVRRHAPTLKALCLRLRAMVHTLRECSGMSDARIDARIHHCQETVLETESALTLQERNLHKKIQKIAESVSTDVYVALGQHTEELIEAALGDRDVFCARLSGLINRVCEASIKNTINVQFEEFFIQTQLSAAISNVLPENTVQQIKTTLEKVSNILGRLKESMQSTNYKVLSTAIALTTSVLNPIIELGLIFLPEIIDAFYNPQEEARAQVRAQLGTVIFPRIRQEVYTQVAAQLPELEKEMLNSLHAEWMTPLKEVHHALEFARKEKAASESKRQDDLDMYSRDIDRLDALLRDIDRLFEGEQEK